MDSEKKTTKKLVEWFFDDFINDRKRRGFFL